MVNKNYYVDAKNLRAGDILQTVNGKTVVVEQVQHEILESPVTVYNFEVEDNHNYFVGNSAKSGCGGYVLTHNMCGATTAGKAVAGGGTGHLSEAAKAILAALGISSSVAFAKTISDTITDTKTKTKDKEDRTERHHIVAQHATLAYASVEILKKAGYTVNDPINLVDLDYDQHRHLHTNRYHARVLMDMLKACYRACNNSNIDNEITGLQNIICDVSSKPADIRKLINKVYESINSMLEIFDNNPEAKAKLSIEVAKTLTKIKVALKEKTYMTVGI